VQCVVGVAGDVPVVVVGLVMVVSAQSGEVVQGGGSAA